MSADPTQFQSFDLDDMFRGGGAPAVKFKNVGDTHGGPILGLEVQQERDFDDPSKLLTWDDGRPKMMLVVTVQTDQREDADDDGQRRIFARYGMFVAIKDAVRKAGANKPEVGGKLVVRYTGDAKPTRKGFSGAKQFAAVYEPPAQAKVADMFADVDDDADDTTPAGDDTADLAAALSALGK